MKTPGKIIEKRTLYIGDGLTRDIVIRMQSSSALSNRTVFYVECAAEDMVVEHSSIDQAINEVGKQLRNKLSLEWACFVGIRVDDQIDVFNPDRSSGMRISWSFYIQAVNAAGEYFSKDTARPNDPGYGSNMRKMKVIDRVVAGTTILPYTKELEAQLYTLRDKVTDLCALVKAALSPDRAIATLESNTLKLTKNEPS